MWGMDGYIAISMRDNICGVTLETTIPNVDFEWYIISSLIKMIISQSYTYSWSKTV